MGPRRDCAHVLSRRGPAKHETRAADVNADRAGPCITLGVVEPERDFGPGIRIRAEYSDRS